MRLIFIRHAEPDYAHNTITEKGWREAKLLAPRVASWDIREIYCSPLGRAKDTAKPALEQLGRTAVECSWLTEFDGWTEDPVLGKRHVPLWDLMPDQWTKNPLYYDKDRWTQTELMKTGNVETLHREVCGAFDALLAEYGYRRDGGMYRFSQSCDDTLVFFCHLGVTCVLAGHLMNIAPPLLWHGLFLPPSSITVFATEEREPGCAYFRCQTMGDVSHLLRGGEPVSHMGYFTKPFQG